MTHEERWLIEELATANGWPTETLEAVLSVWPQLRNLPNDTEFVEMRLRRRHPR